MGKLRVGITGAKGFIGSHVAERIGRDKDVELTTNDIGLFEDDAMLREFVSGCDVIVHLAAMNRGSDDDIYNTNVNTVKTLISFMGDAGVKPHVIFASSTQQELDNPYGRSKLEGARLLAEWSGRSGAPVSLLVIPNVYGDGCRPFYNSVVATFCHQVAHGESPTIIKDKDVDFIYINELSEYIYEVAKNPPAGVVERQVPASSIMPVSRLLSVLQGFREDFFTKGVIPVPAEPMLANLYNVFMTYMEYGDYAHSPVVHKDDRGELFEVIKLSAGGQIFFSTTVPGVVRGNHYHSRKIERFCVLKGDAVIRLRKIGTDNAVEYNVSGKSPKFIDIPIFHTHNIENVGDTDLLTLFWSNELFDPTDMDTFFEEV